MMKRLSLFIGLLVYPAMAWCDFSGYTYRQTITISSSVVSQINHVPVTNFPTLVSDNDPTLSTTTASGGLSLTGYDIIFSTDSDCHSTLFFDTETVMNVGISTSNVWVNMPSLSTTTSNILYRCIGNSSITSYQGNASSVYDAFTMLVAHLANGTALSVADATGHQTLTNNSNTAGDGVIDGAAFNTGANTRDILTAAPVGLYNMPATTYSAWINISRIQNPDLDTSMQIEGLGTRSFGVNKSSTVSASISTTSSFRASGTSTLLSTGTWTKVDATWDSAGDSKWRIYINGIEASYSSQSAGSGTNSPDSGNFSIGSAAGNTFFANFDGGLDEVRVSSTSRTADWINTEYLNQSNPSAFYSESAFQGSSTGPSNILMFGSPL